MAEFFRMVILLFGLAFPVPTISPFPFKFPFPLAPRPTATPTAQPQPTSTFTHTATALPTETPPPLPTKTPTVAPTQTPTPAATLTFTQTPTFTLVPTSTFTAVPTPETSQSDPLGIEVAGVPPAQKLPSAFLIFPLVRASATQDTRVEIMNVTAAQVSMRCFYVASGTCNEIGFYTTLTANQPVQWMVSSGESSGSGRLAPPFTGEGELKCVVTTQSSDPAVHNALQGRAVLSDTKSGETLGYAASAFRRLGPGGFSGEIALDGVTYEQCPDRLHFHALASQTSSSTHDSELILVPCSEDLVGQVPSSTVVQFAVINEFEQHQSASITVKCFERRAFNTIPPLRQRSSGSDTVHLIVRALDVPVVGLVIDRFDAGGAISASTNDPYLEGGHSALVSMP